MSTKEAATGEGAASSSQITATAGELQPCTLCPCPTLLPGTFSDDKCYNSKCGHAYSEHPLLSPGWSYIGATGPVVWHTLRPWPQWAACAVSTEQSPINLVPSKTTTERPTICIPTVPSAKFYYDGHTLKVDLPRETRTGGTTQFRGKSYSVQQFHFHTPSEHFVDGEFFPLEMHIVHRAVADRTLLVLGVLIDITKGATTPFIRSTMKNIRKILVPNGPPRATTTGPLDFSDIVDLFCTNSESGSESDSESQLYHYTGSLTTPPCTPGVTWIVAKNRLSIDLDLWQSAKRIMKFNARYIQNDPGQQNLLTIAANGLHCHYEAA